MTLRNGFSLGSCNIYPLEGRVVKGQEEQRIQPKSMDVLLCLAEHAGAVVEREELLRRVWGDRAPSDEPLTRCVGELRRALGDTRAEPEFIQTIPKRGYRLLPAVAPLVVDPANRRRWQPGTIKKVVAGVTILLVVTLFALLGGRDPERADHDTRVISAKRSIAVLPFANLSSDKEQEYFSDGVTEELLNLLTRIPGLRVISRSSAFSYKGKDIDIPTVAEQLNVTHVLEGSIRKFGGQVRITAQLIEARSDSHIWSETYERTLGDIFATQDEIAARVVDRLKIELMTDAPKARAGDPEAYALFLQARHLARQFTPVAFEQSIELYEKALRRDPEFAAAWDELGRVYRRQAGQGLLPIEESFTLARAATNRALALDPELVSAHRSLAVIARVHDRDMAAAARHIERALALEPSNAKSISNAAAMAGSLGRLAQAIALAEYAVARDPVNPLGITYLGILYLHAGRTQEAIASFRTTTILSPGYVGGQFLIGEGLLLQGDPEAAQAAVQKEVDEGYRLIGMAMVQHALGQLAASDATLAELIEKYEQDAAYNIANVLAFRNEPDRAFDWLNKAVAYRDPGLTDIATDPLFTNIRNDPRWLPLLESIGKSSEQLAAIEFDITIPESSEF